MRFALWLSLLGIALTLQPSLAPVLAKDLPQPIHPWTADGVAWLASQNDFLGARVLAKRLAAGKPDYPHWRAIRDVINRYPEIGSDLIFGWEAIRPPGPEVKETEIDLRIDYGDRLMLEKNYKPAYDQFAAAARSLKAQVASTSPQIASDAKFLYPYVLHRMGRALYSLGQFDQSLVVYQWIHPTYMRFRQVLFEKMWAGFRAGRVDLALGAIASQRSAYFSNYLEPESYLILVYLYKVLCRDDDLKAVVKEISYVKERLDTRKLDYAESARSELESRILLRLANEPAPSELPPITMAERKSEQAKIKRWLLQIYESKRARELQELDFVKAYSQLAVLPGMGSALKPLKTIRGREELLKSNLEIWPADSPENWIDEIGAHQFIGESLCKTGR